MTLLEEFAAWLHSLPSPSPVVISSPYVIIACRAGHERSSAAILLAHVAFAHLVAGDMHHVMAADKALAQRLEPQRIGWDLGVVALMETMHQVRPP